MTTPAPADQLRDRIIAALDNARHTHPCPATGSQYWTGCYHSDGTGPSCHSERRADAVLAVLREPLARQVLGTPTTDPAPDGCPCAVGVASAQCSPRGCAPAPECRECGDTGACAGGPCPLAAPASAPAAPAESADRRARYAAAIREESSRVDDIAISDAVMAVADAEQADLRAELARVKDHRAYWHYEVRNADARIRELDTEVQQWRSTFGRDALPGALRRLETAETHRLALSEALGLGTGAPWDAIRDRTAELRCLADEAQPTGVAGPETLSALMATIQELRALQQPLVDGLRFIWEDMDRVHKGGDEWATEWMAQVWMELPLQVRAAGGDTDAAQELADEARRTEPATAATEEPQP